MISNKAYCLIKILFGIVPLSLSTLGLIGRSIGLTGDMIGVQVVAKLLPSWILLSFVVMLLAGLSSTLDSGLAAFSSLWVKDMMFLIA